MTNHVTVGAVHTHTHTHTHTSKLIEFNRDTAIFSAPYKVYYKR